MTTHKPIGEELQKYNEMVQAFSVSLRELFRIYGNNIKSMNITTDKGFMTKQIRINIRVDLENAVI